MIYLKEYAVFDNKGKVLCEHCGEPIEYRISKSLNSDELICVKCKEKEYEDIKSININTIDFHTMDTSFIPQTTKSQNTKYL